MVTFGAFAVVVIGVVNADAVDTFAGLVNCGNVVRMHAID